MIESTTDARRIRVEAASGAKLEEALDALLDADPDLPYAGFSAFRDRRESLLAMHRRRWSAAADELGALVASDETGAPCAALCFVHRAFESEHFGMPMAQIGPPAAVADERRRLPALRALYGAARDFLGSRGYRHVAAHASAGDRVAGHVLQEVGAYYVGTKIHWMAPLDGRPTSRELLEGGLTIRGYAREEISDIPPEAWARLREWGRRGFAYGPLVFDVRLPRDRARRVYQVWTERAMEGDWAEALYVVWDGDEIVAFNCVMLLEEMSKAAGVRIVGRGIGSTLPGYRGLFTALQRTMIADRPLDGEFLENETRAATLQTINVFGKLGQCVRSTATFHLHLASDASDRGDAPPAAARRVTASKAAS